MANRNMLKLARQYLETGKEPILHDSGTKREFRQAMLQVRREVAVCKVGTKPKKATRQPA
jgi:hypothetical protein